VTEYGGVRPLAKDRDMNSMAEIFPKPPRFVVQSDLFGVYVRDTFSGHAVRDGKENVIRFPDSKRDEIQDIADHMNELTAGISFEDSAVNIPTDQELAA
jgi:hypothetical protein